MYFAMSFYQRGIFKMVKPVLHKQSCSYGQGVIEYAGALVVAGVLISLALTANFGSIATMFSDIISVIGGIFNDTLATL